MPSPYSPRVAEYQKAYRKRPGVADRLSKRRKSEQGKARWFAAHIKSKYGLELDTYLAMVLAQSGKCACCGRLMTYGKMYDASHCCIDHDHRKQKGDREYVRGLLCRRCNLAAGHVDDSPELARQVALYLEQHR
jgi:hypothetical protein